MSSIRRLFQILFALWGFALWSLLVHLQWLKPKTSPADRFAGTLDRLGTTFIKLGQALSLRHDLLPPSYIEALQQLQERATPFPSEQAQHDIEAAFQKPISQLFAAFDAAPLAAASMAQVHTAELFDGRAVVVKVRRPGIERQVVRDMRLLRFAMRLFVTLLPRYRKYDPLSVIDEIEDDLRNEMDFTLEARNIRRFARAFADSNEVYVPQVIDNSYTESVIVQERSRGVRLDTPEAIADGPRLARSLMNAYVHQFLVLGAFHADPHPGNLFLLPDGRICFHDFGAIGNLDRASRRNIAAFFQALLYQDSDWLLDVYLDMGILVGELNRETLRRDLEGLLHEYSALPVKEWSIGEVFMTMARMSWGHNVRLPQHLLVLARSMFLLETTIGSLDPEFNLLGFLVEKGQEALASRASRGELAGEWARVKFELGTSVEELPRVLARWIHRAGRGNVALRLRHDGLERLENHIDRASNRLALAMVAVGLYVAASLMALTDIPPLLLGLSLFAWAGYGVALLVTWRLATGIGRSGRL